jgi:hypothetical protein
MEQVNKIDYNPETDTITFNDKLTVVPDDLLEALDDSLLMKIQAIRRSRVVNMTDFLQKVEELEKQVSKAETKFDIEKIIAQKNIIREKRFTIKLLENEEKNVKNRILERQLSNIER